MTRLLTTTSTVLSLGLVSVARVARYRIGLRCPFSSLRSTKAVAASGPYFTRPAVDPVVTPRQWTDETVYFGWYRQPLSGGVPDWFRNPFSRRSVTDPSRDWWQIPDFDTDIGDIKSIWEVSRFDWLLVLAQRARAGDAEALPRLELWLSDWCRFNSPFRGPNWKCGQEASIRVMHLAVAAAILDNDAHTLPGLADLVAIHLQRIEPTIGYAIGQDNNHGTSEAAALFIGGTWLARRGDHRADAWARQGRRWLEDRVNRLIEKDGSFSQYSLNYHRLLLDTLCVAEVWRRRVGATAFSDAFVGKAASAARWLHAMIDPGTGDGPNLGANDGARLTPLTDADYRDFRPTVQASMALFDGTRAFASPGHWDAHLAWLGIRCPETMAPARGSCLFDDGGYAMLRSPGVMAMMRYPRFHFRPSHADALHVDLWRDGHCLLRDAGTFSYNSPPHLLAYFPGTASHNTIQFDDRDQMPRLSRFLFGNWLKSEAVTMRNDPGPVATASYRDGFGVRHEREVRLLADRLVVRDLIDGPYRKAVLRWRLAPGSWKREGLSFSNGYDRLEIAADMEIERIELSDGRESLYYAQMTSCPVVEIEVRRGGSITSEYVWQK